MAVLGAAQHLRRMRGDDELQPRERFSKAGERLALPPWVEVEVELVDEHHALHSCGRIGAIELVEHDRAAGDVGDQRDEQRGSRRTARTTAPRAHP